MGWLLYRMGQEPARTRAARPLPYGEPHVPVEPQVPVMNTGQARIYDPDVSSVPPRDPLMHEPLAQDPLGVRRDLTARA
jgi:hypothetical protein